MEVVAMTEWKLEALEQVIEKGMASFQLVGNALMAIRDAKLYRETHDTFEAYCKERWGLSRPRAYELIGASKVADNLSGMPDKPANARQVAPLTALPPDKQAAAWQEAVETAPEGKVTARHVQETVERLGGNVTEVYEHRKVEFVETDQFVLLAINQLSKIDKHCSKRKDAGVKVINWCIKNLCGGKYVQARSRSRN